MRSGMSSASTARSERALPVRWLVPPGARRATLGGKYRSGGAAGVGGSHAGYVYGNGPLRPRPAASATSQG